MALVPICAGTVSDDPGGAGFLPQCSTGWAWVTDESVLNSGIQYTLSMSDAAAIVGAAAFCFALAWGLRLALDFLLGRR